MPILGIIASSKYVVSGPPVSGYKLWLDATDATSITASGGDVSQWSDKSGNGYHFTQATSANQPKTNTRTINSKNVIDFDGSNDWMSVPSSTGSFNYLHNSTGGTVFIVGINDGSGVLLDNGGDSSGRRGIYHAIGSGNLTDLLITTGGGSGTVAALQFGLTDVGTSAFYLTNKWNAGNATAGDRLKESLNGAAFTGANILTTSASSSNATNNLTLSAADGGAGGYWNGAYGEIIIYEGILSAGDITSVQSYLATKWGI